MVKPLYALVDCNNFYVSCERLFRPDLRQRPVVVLSNNDGCIVSRSNEAKALGIAMGVPLFQIQDAIRSHGIEVFSSNYALYADLSDRVMNTLAAEVPAIERYSIDESFLDISGLQQNGQDLQAWALHLKARVLQYTGIPVSIGLAPSKTLAKLANWASKRWPQTGGVVDLRDPIRQRKLLALAPVEQVWGIGRRLSRRLHLLGIERASDLASYDQRLLQRSFNSVLQRTARELAGEACFPLEDGPERKKMIASTRSFSTRIYQQNGLAEAITLYTSRAAEKLRAQQSLCRVLHLFIRTGAYDGDQAQRQQITLELPYPSADTRDLVQLALQGLRQIYRPGIGYAKAGVILMELIEPGQYTPDLFQPQPRRGSDELMAVMDRINQYQGRGSIRLGRLPANPAWRMRQAFKSPAYTTQWKDLPRAT